MSTTNLNNKEKKILVPKLRFSEFDGKWEKRKLGEIYKISAGGDIDSNRVSFEKTEKFKYPIYANAKKDKGFYGYSDIYKIESGTITVAGRGVYIGIANARDHKYYPIVRLLVLKPIKNEDIYFSENVINRLNLFIESTGVPQLTAPQFSNYKISIPSLPEQQKIATFLSAVDEKNQQLSRKKELLEQYKKGVMQQLVSGKLRFKDENGEDYPDWEEKKLGKLIKIKSGNSPSDYRFINNGVYPFIKVEELNNCTKYQKSSRFYSNDDKNLIEEKCVIFPKRGAAILNNKIRISECPILMDSNMMALIPLKKELNVEFLYYKIMMAELFKIADTSSIPQINNKHIEPYIIFKPCLQEQHKIANFLMSIDVKIENTNQQLKQAQKFRKGLLQQMFV